MAVNLKINFKAEDLAPTKQAIGKAARLVGPMMVETIRQRTQRGEFGRGSRLHQQYSTVPARYNIYRSGRPGRFRQAAKAQKDRLSGSRMWMPGGYVEWKSIFLGRAVARSPVDLTLTGHMLKSMRPVVKVSARQANITVQMGRTGRAGEPSPHQLMLYHQVWGIRSRRGKVIRKFLYLRPSEADRIARTALISAGVIKK